ncbi:hypothetical protein V7124_19525 [Neobacillus niacini]
MNELTREQKIERILEVALNQVKKMVEDGEPIERITRFNQSQLELIALIK